MEVNMEKRILSKTGLLILAALLAGALTAAAPFAVPTTDFELVSGLPAVMNVGDTATVVVQVTSDQEFIFAQVLPTAWFPGRGVTAVNPGGDRVHANTTATLEVTFVAKESTADFPNEGACPTGGVAPVAVVAGVRYPGGLVVSQRFPESGFFCVAVP
jgi:hypothetical protein